MYERQKRAEANPARVVRVAGQNMALLLALVILWCWMFAFYEIPVEIFIAGLIILCVVIWMLDKRL